MRIFVIKLMHRIRFFVFRNNLLASRVQAAVCCCTCSNSWTTNPAVRLIREPTDALNKIHFMTSISYAISSGDARSRRMFLHLIPREYKQLRTYTWNGSLSHVILISRNCRLFKIIILCLSTLCILEI